jgi:hypothetical protein
MTKRLLLVTLCLLALFGAGVFAQDSGSSAADSALPQPEDYKPPKKTAEKKSQDDGMFQPVEPAYATLDAGIILLAQPGGSEWQHKLDKARQLAIDPKLPVETIYDPGDQRALQGAVDKIDARGVRRIIVIPAVTSSSSEALDQTRYLFGFMKKPSKKYLESPHVNYNSASLSRIKTKTPVVITDALDAGGEVTAALGAWVESFKNSVDDDISLVIAAVANDTGSDYAEEQSSLDAITGALRKKYKLAAARGVLLRSNTERMNSGAGFTKMPPAGSQDKLALSKTGKEGVSASADELRHAVMECSKTSKVLVLAYSLNGGELDKMVKDDLKGAFYAWGGTVTLSQSQVESWLKARLAEGMDAKPQPRYTKPALNIDGKQGNSGLNSGTWQ